MKKVAGKLKLAHAQFRELQAFAQFALTWTRRPARRSCRARRSTNFEAGRPGPMPVEKQVCVFYAVLNNYFEALRWKISRRRRTTSWNILVVCTKKMF